MFTALTVTFVHALDTVGYSVHELHFLKGVILDDSFDVWLALHGLPKSHVDWRKEYSDV